MATTLANLRNLAPKERQDIMAGRVPGHVYIGRRREAMHYGNPFTHEGVVAAKSCIVVPTREQAVACFVDWMYQADDGPATPWYGHEPERREWIWKHLQDLWDKTLWCWCCPDDCHGDWYVQTIQTIESHGHEVFG